MKISVIVPVYKVGDYLTSCVESILGQTYSNLELILVDDGSPDNSPALCDSAADCDSRVKVIHQENQGAAVARNMGMAHATGDYIAFCDGDDRVPSNAYELLIQKAVETKGDLICGNIKSLDEQGNGIGEWVVDEKKARSGLILLEQPITNPALFKTAFIRKHNLKFPSSVVGEDAIFSAKVFLCRPRIAWVKEITYLYYIRKNAQNLSLSQRKDIKAVTAAISCRIAEAKISEEYGNRALKTYCVAFFYPSLELWRHADEEFRTILFKLLQEYAELFSEKRERKILEVWSGVSYDSFLQMTEGTYRSKVDRMDWEQRSVVYKAVIGQLGLKEVTHLWRRDGELAIRCFAHWLSYKRLSLQERLRRYEPDLRFVDEV